MGFLKTRGYRTKAKTVSTYTESRSIIILLEHPGSSPEITALLPWCTITGQRCQEKGPRWPRKAFVRRLLQGVPHQRSTPLILYSSSIQGSCEMVRWGIFSSTDMSIFWVSSSKPDLCSLGKIEIKCFFFSFSFVHSIASLHSDVYLSSPLYSLLEITGRIALNLKNKHASFL